MRIFLQNSEQQKKQNFRIDLESDHLIANYKNYFNKKNKNKKNERKIFYGQKLIKIEILKGFL
jgi:hypothetical protein